MKVKTKHREGIAIQYKGDNIEEIKNTFDIEYKQLNSTTYWNGQSFKDYCIYRDGWQSDLLAGDVVFQQDKLEVIPLMIFEEYWESA